MSKLTKVLYILLINAIIAGVYLGAAYYFGLLEETTATAFFAGTGGGFALHYISWENTKKWWLDGRSKSNN